MLPRTISSTKTAKRQMVKLSGRQRSFRFWIVFACPFIVTVGVVSSCSIRRVRKIWRGQSDLSKNAAGRYSDRAVLQCGPSMSRSHMVVAGTVYRRPAFGLRQIKREITAEIVLAKRRFVL